MVEELDQRLDVALRLVPLETMSGPMWVNRLVMWSEPLMVE